MLLHPADLGIHHVHSVELQEHMLADPRYAQAADLSFRCNVDYRGAVSNVRVSRYQTAYRR